MSERLDGRLSDEAGRVLDDHLHVCAACRARWQAMQHVSAVFQAAEMALPPPTFTGRVMGRLAAQQAEQQGQRELRQSRRLAWGAAATALLMIFAVAAVYAMQAPVQPAAAGGPAFDVLSASMQVSGAVIQMSAIVESNLSIIYTLSRLLPLPILALGVLWLVGGTLGLAFTVASVVSAYQPLRRVVVETSGS